QQTLQQRGRVGAGACGTFARALLQDGVDLVPNLAVDDGVMLAGVALALVHRLADVRAVVQHPVEVLLVDPVSARRADAACANLSRQFRAGPDLEEAREDPMHMRSGYLVDHQLPVLDAIAEGRHPAHPHALLPTGGDLVADAFG